MSVLSKLVLSGSTDGKLIDITQEATPGTIIHTAHATALDEIWMWVFNDT